MQAKLTQAESKSISLSLSPPSLTIINFHFKEQSDQSILGGGKDFDPNLFFIFRYC